jgi:hypothetical protein
MVYKNEDDLYKIYFKKKQIYNQFIEELSQLEPFKLSLSYIKGELNVINQLTHALTINRVTYLLTKSPRRLKQVIAGYDILINILNCPDDYHLVIDIDDISTENTFNALVFLDVRNKYCYFKHYKECPKGLSYIGGRWQNQ